jgi:hypothetical protein
MFKVVALCGIQLVRYKMDLANVCFQRYDPAAYIQWAVQEPTEGSNFWEINSYDLSRTRFNLVLPRYTCSQVGSEHVTWLPHRAHKRISCKSQFMMLVLPPSFSEEINLPLAPDVVTLCKSSWSYICLQHLRSTRNHVVVHCAFCEASEMG